MTPQQHFRYRRAGLSPTKRRHPGTLLSGFVLIHYAESNHISDVFLLYAYFVFVCLPFSVCFVPLPNPATQRTVMALGQNKQGFEPKLPAAGS